MKNKLLLVLIALLLLLTSCATVVSIPYMKSSNVDMSRYRNIALASAVPYKGGYMDVVSYMRAYDFESSYYPVYSSYSRQLPQNVADYATDAVVTALSKNGYYSILSPSETDTIIMLSKIGMSSSNKFAEYGVDAVIIPSIDDMKVDEYSKVYIDSYKDAKDPKTGQVVKVPHYTYAYYQRVSVTLSLTVVDTKTERIVAKRSYSNSNPTYIEYTYTPYGQGYVLPYSSVNNPYSSFKSIINDFKGAIISDFIPTRRYYNTELLANKPKVKSLESAYQAAEEGSFELAYNGFIEEWNRSGHINAAYNAALMKAGLGDIDSAIAVLENVMKSVSSGDINYLYNKLVGYKAEDEKAKAQLMSTSSDSASGSSQSIYSIYEALGK